MGNSLYLYNHGQSVYANEGVANLSISKIRECIPSDWDQPPWDDLNKLPNLLDGMALASHVIGHFDSEGSADITLETLNTENPPANQLHVTQYVLVLTTQPGMPNKFKHQDKSSDSLDILKRRRFILYARDCAAAKLPETLKAFFSITPSIAESIVVGQVEGVPEDLRDIFGLSPQPHNLLAISILCQGVLILAADIGNGFPNIKNTDKHYEIVAQAMNHLFPGGWQDLPVTLGSDRKKKTLSEMHSGGWWQDVFAETDDLETALKREWGNKDDKGWQCVEELVKKIIKHTPTSPSDIQLGKVAAAYNAVSTRLGQK